VEPGYDIVFYDGACGLCHRLVKFILPRDRRGVFRFAALESETFRTRVPEPARIGLPDSVVVLTDDGRVLVRSAATRRILSRLAWWWRVAGAVLGVLPRGFADWGYDVIARSRHRLFKRPSEACPVVPPELRARFLS
jgi:predicted DCC family thiol-disulfide oxidoreductase YuxK